MTPTLLIVEDDAALARLAARVAEETGFDVVVRHDGNAARDLLETEAPDALLNVCNAFNCGGDFAVRSNGSGTDVCHYHNQEL